MHVLLHVSVLLKQENKQAKPRSKKGGKGKNKNEPKVEDAKVGLCDYACVNVLLRLCVCPVAPMRMSCCINVYVLLHESVCPVALMFMSCCTKAYVLLHECVCPVA